MLREPYKKNKEGTSHMDQHFQTPKWMRMAANPPDDLLLNPAFVNLHSKLSQLLSTDSHTVIII